jgi:hypothetical protein
MDMRSVAAFLKQHAAKRAIESVLLFDRAPMILI